MSKSVLSLHEKFPVTEMYQFAQGDKHNWGFLGYSVPKTYDYTYQEPEHLFPKEKRPDPVTIAGKRGTDPGPTSYAPDLTKAAKKSWKSIGALFAKAKKDSVHDSALKLSARLPGPGSYMEEPKKPIPKTASFGKFE
jgi:hypothetical protein